jgi:hypothetical protein
MGWDQWLAERGDDLRLFFDATSAWQHVAILLAFTACALGAAIFLLHRREYVTSDEA